MKDKLGLLGTLFASLCCLGVSIVVAPLTAIGLGFLINDLILLPLVLVFLLITLWGLHAGWKRHGVQWPFFLGIFAAVLLIPSFFVNAYLAALLLILLLAATIWNTVAAVKPVKHA
jgi:mercuric ion transport protein